MERPFDLAVDDNPRDEIGAMPARDGEM